MKKTAMISLDTRDKHLRRSPRLMEHQQLVDVKKTTMICLDTSNKCRRSPRLLECQQLSVLGVRTSWSQRQIAKQESIDSSTSATDPSIEDDTLHLGSNNPPYSNRLLRIEIVKGLLHNDKSSVSPSEKPSKKRKRAGTSLRVKHRHVNSLLLSQKSKFFHKLFFNGMRESDPQSTVLLKIDSSEEESFFQLLNHMYRKKKKSSSKKIVTRTSLLRLLFLADKFEVPSCINHCVQKLVGMKMTEKFVIRVLEIPSWLRMRPDIRPLIDEAEKFLAHKFANVAENVDKLKNIDMAVLESMLSRDDLKAGSEDEVFDMVVQLARSRFPKEELREALTPLISRIVRFTYVSCEKLNEALTFDDLDQEVIKNAVLEAHFFKEKPLYCRRALIANLKESIARLFVRRAYTLLPIKFVELEHPNTQCIVYLDIKLEEFANLSPGDHMRSESFHFLEQKFHIEVRKKNAFPGKFRVYLSITNRLVHKIKANVQFAVRTKRCGDFYPWKISHMSHVFDEDVETWRHFLCKGTAIIAHDNFYFINGTTLYLRVVVTNLS